jgi:hypothetical protein
MRKESAIQRKELLRIYWDRGAPTAVTAASVPTTTILQREF